MSTHYTPSSGATRLVATVLASLIAVTLCSAVAVGLTGEDASVLLAQATAHPVTVAEPVAVAAR